MTGTIQSLDTRGFGFINGDDGVRRFFPAKEVRGIAFDKLTVGLRVSYKPVAHPFKGPRAFTVELLPLGNAKAAA